MTARLQLPSRKVTVHAYSIDEQDDHANRKQDNNVKRQLPLV